MLLRLEHLDGAAPLRAAVCIAGAGAAGITLACELDGTGIAVLLLDAGFADGRAAVSQDPYGGRSEAPHAPPAHFRRRGFGGTTAIWGGRCVPYDPIDFEPRDYVAESGWPVSYGEVARHYPAAMAYCDAGEFVFDARQAFDRRIDAFPGLAACGDFRVDAMERYSRPIDFGTRYRERLAKSRNVRVLGGAHVLRLLRDHDADRITALECRAGEGGPLVRIEAEHFVLAMGGIETPRLLLASQPGGVGLGNRHDCVGRYYACHLENTIGVLRPKGERVAFDFETTRDGVYARRKLLIDAAAQRRERLLNIAFRLHYPDVSDPAHRSSVLSAVYLAKRTLIPEYRRILQHGRAETGPPRVAAHLANVARGVPRLATFGAAWLRRRVFARRKLPYVLVANADGSYPIEFNAEQTPLRESRIVLARECDAFGTPRVDVRWRICDADIDSICRAYLLLRRCVQAGGNCALELDEPALRAAVASSMPVGGHHIGTTRMAMSPHKGVVDRNCAVFDFPNLYIAGAAVFPTSSHANPTLTIVAMAIRLAAHLRTTCAAEVALA